MLFRFSLYGFLKNQRYFEPFLILAFREKGLSFFQIGVLIAFREVSINLFEVPTGAVADVCGRRRSMILSFTAYVFSFVVFALAPTLWSLLPAMLLFALGEAFRTGTHKAMIFDWLSQQGRSQERTRVYGYTRSWSKIGSATSVIIAAALVLISGNYQYIFWLSIPPYLLNIINFTGYPRTLDCRSPQPPSIGRILRLLGRTLLDTAHRPALRGLVLESMLFEGSFEAIKDYLQPILKQAALMLPLFLLLSAERRTAILVGIVFFALHLMESAAARRSHTVADRAGGELQANRLVWMLVLFGYAAIGVTLRLNWIGATLLVYLLLYLSQNVWRPVMVSRFGSHADESSMATLLSIGSQAKTVTTMVVAPLLGLGVDHWGFWTIGVVGAAAAACGLWANLRAAAPSARSREG
jgi:MFS family permease